MILHDIFRYGSNFSLKEMNFLSRFFGEKLWVLVVDLASTHLVII